MGAYISKSKRCYNAKPLAYYFYMRMNIPLNFCICIMFTKKVLAKKLYSGNDFFLKNVVLE